MITSRLSRKRVNPHQSVFTGVNSDDEVAVQLFAFDALSCVEDAEFEISELIKFDNKEKNFWLNVHGIHQMNIVDAIRDKLLIHDLAIQDLLDVNQRPKLQEYDEYWFFTLKSIIPTIDNSLEVEQLSFIFGENYIVSFQERKADYFNHIRERLRKNIGVVRSKSVDYLLYLLLESILDNYSITINDIENKIKDLVRIDMESDPSPSIIKEVESYKRNVHQIKKTIVPFKDFIIKAERENFAFVSQNNQKYYYEIKDLCLSLIDDCEQIEVRLESSSNLFFSVQGSRMNQVMKTLTIVATIFIPLTFIAGIYGMNFSHMPELSWRWGYPAIWGVMIFLFFLMFLYFRKKKWF